MKLRDIRRMTAIILALLVFCSSPAISQSSEEGEEPWTGGVFDNREGGTSVDLPLPDNIPLPPIINNRGETNELVLLPDYSDGSFIQAAVPSVNKGTDMRPEDVLIHAVNINTPTTLSALGNPTKGARYVIKDGRLDELARRRLSYNDPVEELHRFIILSYPSIDAAKSALQLLAGQRGLITVALNRALDFSFYPNDPYFAVKPQAPLYQWGMHAMNFPSAWDRTKGHGYVGLVDSMSYLSTHADLSNVRSQLSFIDQSYSNSYHGLHVAGVIGGTQNNGLGVTGGCPNCSIASAQSNLTDSSIANSLYGLISRGVSVINLSFGSDTGSCSVLPLTCAAINNANQRDVLLVGAAGNFRKTSPQYPASDPSLLSVGGAQSAGGTNWNLWIYDAANGTNYAGSSGVIAPARSVVSTTPSGGSWNPYPQYMCADTSGVDESGIPGDGYGSCTGTSMSAPHITALAGLVRSIYPRLSKDSIKSIIRNSGNRAGFPDSQYGYGMPNARSTVDLTMSYNPYRLTPLFAFYSAQREDYFYTTSPQMGAAARSGTIRPAPIIQSPPYEVFPQYETRGITINAYLNFPGMPGGWQDYIPRAQVWIFTTQDNPITPSIPLVPLYRLSWKCGDSYSPACAGNPYHTDFVYTADTAGISAYQSVGYKLDGIEGYIYPKTVSQPAGSVRLMRKYNPTRDDHAIFPESELAAMASQGYTQNSGSDWLGYVYPNLTGAMPIY
jgi:serine protease